IFWQKASRLLIFEERPRPDTKMQKATHHQPVREFAALLLPDLGAEYVAQRVRAAPDYERAMGLFSPLLGRVPPYEEWTSRMLNRNQFHLAATPFDLFRHVAPFS